MIVVTVARRPLSAGSVAANVLEHGTGAINVDGCRIRTTEDLNGGAYTLDRQPRAMSPSGAGERHVTDCGTFEQPSGRWPANLILSHRDGCRVVGETTVAAAGHWPSARPRGSEVSGPSGHAGQDGLVERSMTSEVVPLWECEAGCPVLGMDAQSGVQKSGVAVQRHGGGQAFFGGISEGKNTVGVRLDAGYGDTGGASRFFKQVGGQQG